MIKQVLTFSGGAVQVETSGKVFVKDVLRTGNWHLSNGEWDVTPETLQLIVDGFNKYTGRKYSVPLIWDHSNKSSDTIGRVLSLWIEGEVLKARVKITDQKALELIETCVDTVSVGIMQDCKDGEGNDYPFLMYELSLVNTPVVSMQEPFKQMKLLSSKEVKNMADDPNVTPAETPAETPVSSVSKMSLGDVANDPEAFKKLVDYVNDILGATESSFQLNGDVDPDNFMLYLSIAAGMFENDDDGDEMEGDSEESPEVPLPVSPEMGLKQIADITKRLSALEKGVSELAKDGFNSKLDYLVSTGSILPSHKASLLEKGKENNYSLSLLSGFGASKSFASSQKTPKVKAESEAATTDEIFKAFGLNVK
jgi:hypothetical protein